MLAELLKVVSETSEFHRIQREELLKAKNNSY